MSRFYPIVIFIIFAIPPVLADTNDIKKIATAYSSDKNILLVVYDKNEKIENSEAYADWSAYLNDFSASAKNRFLITTITPKDLANLIEDSVKYSEPYTTLFLNKNLGSFYYPGPVLEPGVYIYVDTYYQKNKISTELEMYKPEKTTINFKENIGNVGK